MEKERRKPDLAAFLFLYGIISCELLITVARFFLFISIELIYRIEKRADVFPWRMSWYVAA